MKKLTLFLLLMLGYFALDQISAQTRYLEPVFARNQIQVQKNVTYGVNATILYQTVLGEAVPQQLVMDVYRPASEVAMGLAPAIYAALDGNLAAYVEASIDTHGALDGRREVID